MIYYSKSVGINGGFIDSEIIKSVPGDAVEITEDERSQLLEGLAQGFEIAPDENGAPYLKAPNAATEQQVIDVFKEAIQSHMDQSAKALGYDDIRTVVTYAEEPAVPKFQAEGQALRAWRSLVWAYGYEQIEAVQSGSRPMPTMEALISELPPLVMPS